MPHRSGYEKIPAGDAIEVNVVSERLVLIRPGLLPSLYLLRRRGKPIVALNLPPDAGKTYEYILQRGRATAGQIRTHLKANGLPRPDPADVALAALQKQMLLDRGPSDVPERGIPYLAKEGYPYRLLERVHAKCLAETRATAVEKAMEIIVLAYLRPAVYCPVRKLAAMFKLCFSYEELAGTIAALCDAGLVKLLRSSRQEIVKNASS